MKSALICLFLLLHCGLLLAQTPTPQVLATGKVVNGDGKPVANATVIGMIDQATSSDSYSTRSDASGEFSIAVRNTSIYTSLRFSAWKPGYSQADQVRTPPMGQPGHKQMTLVLRPAVDFTVIVVDRESKPIPDAAVVISRADAEAGHERLVTDREGKAVSRDRNDQDRLDVEVTVAGYLKGKAWAETLTAKSVKVVLSKGGTLVCRLLDAQTGKPLANTLVQLPYLDHAECKTGDDGIFRAVDVPFGTVHVAMPGSGYTHDWNHALGGFRVDFPADSTDQIHKLAVRHDYLIEGTVVDAAKQPLPGVTVFLEPLDITAKRDLLAAQTKTDAKGHFQFDKFSVDHFRVLASDGYESTPVECRYAELKGPITIVAAQKKPRAAQP